MSITGSLLKSYLFLNTLTILYVLYGTHLQRKQSIMNGFSTPLNIEFK